MKKLFKLFGLTVICCLIVAVSVACASDNNGDTGRTESTANVNTDAQTQIGTENTDESTSDTLPTADISDESASKPSDDPSGGEENTENNTDEVGVIIPWEEGTQPAEA